EEKVGRVIYFNKGGLKVILTEGLRDEPLDTPDNLCSPTFLVPEDYEELLLKNRVSATLQTEIVPERSLLLIIGSTEAEEIVHLPADTLQDGRGISMDWLREFLSRGRREIAIGKRAYLVAGASSLGNPGIRYFEERTGKKVSSLLCNQNF
ncbi:MAG: aminopeptidase, partial [Aquificota bacterium]